MSYKNEGEIKQALGIESWRNLSRDKMIKFAAMMPDMDAEVALKVIEQFPVFKEFAMDAVNAMEKAHESTLSAHKQSQEHVHQAFQEIREILKGEFSKDELSWEEQKYLIQPAWLQAIHEPIWPGTVLLIAPRPLADPPRLPMAKHVLHPCRPSPRLSPESVFGPIRTLNRR